MDVEKVVESTEQTEVEKKNIEPVVDLFEEEAREQGWKPKEEFQGDPKDWRPAKEFVERGELFDKIHNQGSEIKDLRKALNFLVEHHKKVKDTEYQRALTSLKAMKKDAFEAGDAEKIVELDDAILDVKEQQRQSAETSVPEVKSPSETFVNFVKNNAWYNTNKEMREFADDVGISYFKRNPGVQESDVHEYVIKKVKQAFPDQFQKRSITPSVEGVGEGPLSTNKGREPSLTDEERRVMNTFIRSGLMTKEEYISELGKQ